VAIWHFTLVDGIGPSNDRRTPQAAAGGCHETPHRAHRPQIQRYLTLNKQQE